MKTPLPAAASGKETGRDPIASRMIVRLLVVPALLLAAPLAAAADMLYVSLSNDSIVRYDISLPTAAAVEGSAQVFVASSLILNDPTGLAFDGSGNLYVANQGDHTLVKFDPYRTVQWTAGGAPNLVSPDGVAVGGGYAYVANYLGNSVAQYDLTTGTLVRYLGDATTLTWASGVTVDPSGTVYVSDQYDDRIVRFDPTGAFSIFTAGGSLSAPAGLAFHPSGDLFVANFLGDSISRFDASGAFLATISVPATPGSPPGYPMPYGVTFDPAGNFYTANFYNNTISKFDALGNLLFSWSTGAGSPAFLAVGPAVPGTLATGGVVGGTVLVLLGLHRGVRRRRSTAAMAGWWRRGAPPT